MKQAIGQIRLADLPDDYAGLCRWHLPRPIRDRADYQNTTEITKALAGHDLAPDQEDCFDLLCSLIEDYDRERVASPARKITGLAALQHLLDENGMTAADLARLLGVRRTLGAMILRGERQLTLAHVRTVAEPFKVSAGLFIERPA
jgi:antitoxin component HigA of HigAB toxin-antitoxin module